MPSALCYIIGDAEQCKSVLLLTWHEVENERTGHSRDSAPQQAGTVRRAEWPGNKAAFTPPPHLPPCLLLITAIDLTNSDFHDFTVGIYITGQVHLVYPSNSSLQIPHVRTSRRRLAFCASIRMAVPSQEVTVSSEVLMGEEGDPWIQIPPFVNIHDLCDIHYSTTVP